MHTAGVPSMPCASCHTATAIEAAHVTPYATTNNPSVPAGYSNFEYSIVDVTVNESNQAVVKFRIKKDGTDLDLTTYPPTGFSGGPSFLVAYASPQDDVAAPSDWNQLGRSAGQPASVSVANVIGSATNNGDGTFTATLTTAFPAEAVMRGVALQGYFTQTNVTPSSARHTPSVFKGVTDDPQRRVAVNSAKCLNCHEMLDLHGGNRVNNVQVCVICHNPNLSSSGRGALPANVSAELLAQFNNDPLTFPEDAQNFKDMVHGIHGAAKRDVPFMHVRDRGTSGVYFYDWSQVTYPGQPNNCLACHDDGQYDTALPAGLLMTTVRTTTGNVAETRDDILAARGAVPNATDEVKNVTAAACSGCHTGGMSTAHMESMGAGFGTRGSVIENR
jgi:OmcA/MtrC family decaheme c-type cytochrome